MKIKDIANNLLLITEMLQIILSKRGLFMLLIFMLLLIIASILVLIVKMNKETFYLFAMCISLAFMLTGILIYIAKKGGISRELQSFFYFNDFIKAKIQYSLIKLDNLGYTVAIGRYLFPMFLLLLAFHYSMLSWIRKNYWITRIIIVIPIVTLVVYYPKVSHVLTKDNAGIQLIISNFTYVWIVIYVLLAIVLLLLEAYSIQMKVFQRQFILIATFILSLTLLYLLYFIQDPIQIYQFYSPIGKNKVYYLKAVLSVPTYMTIVLLNVIVAISGFVSLSKYTKEIFESSKEGELIKHKADTANMGITVFVHSIKNQLLANRVIYKRIDNIYKNEQDIKQLEVYTNQLKTLNEDTLSRIDELYNAVKANQVYLVPVVLREVIDIALANFKNKNHIDEVQIDTNIDNHLIVLADKGHLSEAVNNLLINAFEAIISSTEEKKIKINCYKVRFYNVIEIQDSGVGMSNEEMKKICEPFYSNKNSNSNWGMGLYYVRRIAEEHFGRLRFESVKGKGSTFYLLLPKYK